MPLLATTASTMIEDTDFISEINAVLTTEGVVTHNSHIFSTTAEDIAATEDMSATEDNLNDRQNVSEAVYRTYGIAHTVENITATAESIYVTISNVSTENTTAVNVTPEVVYIAEKEDERALATENIPAMKSNAASYNNNSNSTSESTTGIMLCL